MSPEEREEARRARASGKLPGMRLPGEASSSNIEAPPTLGVPVSEPEVPRETLAAPPVGFRFAPRRPEIIGTPRVYILDEDWATEYEGSETFRQLWVDCHNPEGHWPVGIQLIQNKIYLDGKLCVPENRTESLLLAISPNHSRRRCAVFFSR